MTMPRSEMLAGLRKAGLARVADEIAPLLPDPVDFDTAQVRSVFERYGIHPGVLTDLMGGSP
jgi:hypothetical protein